MRIPTLSASTPTYPAASFDPGPAFPIGKFHPAIAPSKFCVGPDVYVCTCPNGYSACCENGQTCVSVSTGGCDCQGYQGPKGKAEEARASKK
jgi:hypothetical protein